MVAAFVFLNFSAAYWTERDVVFDKLVILTPTIKLLLHGFFASVASMPIITTFEADFCSALWTAQFCSLKIIGFYELLAAYLGTPPNEWVSF